MDPTTEITFTTLMDIPRLTVLICSPALHHLRPHLCISFKQAWTIAREEAHSDNPWVDVSEESFFTQVSSNTSKCSH